MDDFIDFAAVVREAAEKTGYTGEEVALVLTHPRLNNHIVEVPPAIKGRALHHFLERRVALLKTFEEEAVWSQQPALATKDADAVLVHLFPKVLLDQLTQGCQTAGLRLVRALPAAMVLGGQLPGLPLAKEDLGLLAAQTAGVTTVIIGRQDGRICLGRVLNESWDDEVNRVAMDLTRTIGFAEQHTGTPVKGVWLFGPVVPDHLTEMQRLLKLPVALSPIEFTDYYWAEQAARPSVQGDGDLVSPVVREAPRRGRLLWVTGAGLLVLLLAALWSAGYFEWRRRDVLKTIVRLEAEAVRSRQIRTDWQQRRADLEKKADLVRIVLDEEPMPLAGWFLGYLSNVGPEALRLTALLMAPTNGLWSVRIAGGNQPTTSGSAMEFREAFNELTNSLASGPFRMTLTLATLDEGEEATPNPPLEEEEPPMAPANGQKPRPKGFVIEGIIR